MVDLFVDHRAWVLLGMRHASDPDHVIAVSTMVDRQQDFARSALIGAFWGVGHTLTILRVGAVIILFNLVIPPRIGLSMELSVGLMLIILGLVNIRRFLRPMHISARAHGQSALIDFHAHGHGRYVHSHPHSHFPEDHPHSSDQTPLGHPDRNFTRLGRYQCLYLRPLIVGIVHGLAGSAAVALLVLATIRNSDWAVAYLLLFGVGTIAGMMLITMSLLHLAMDANKRECLARIGHGLGPP